MSEGRPEAPPRPTLKSTMKSSRTLNADATLYVEKTVKVRNDQGGQLPTRRSSFLRRRSSEYPLDTDTQDPSEHNRPHYRISSELKRNPVSLQNKIKHYLGCWTGSSHHDSFTYDNLIGRNPNAFCWGFDPNRMALTYISWSFRASFFVLFLSLSIFFFVLIILFTFFLMIIGKFYPSCFQPTYNIAGTPFADAYALSWTTFTTVGYGHTFPSMGVHDENQDQCFILHILCSFESFVGVIFAGCCGAIIFGKILRVQSLATVGFSDPITVQYYHAETNEGKCPKLTFRLMNLKSGDVGGEIIDGNLQIIAISLRDKKMRHHNNTVVHEGATRSMSNETQQTIEMDDDPDSRTSVKHIFSKLEVDFSENPYFKRVWTVNHILNHKSPLVIPKVRILIAENGGSWPSDLCTAEKIRESIKFDGIFVSLSGVSVACADSVYTQHMYNYYDMNIGYNFVPCLYRNGNGELHVDYSLLNDVMEQEGGGGEELG